MMREKKERLLTLTDQPHGQATNPSIRQRSQEFELLRLEVLTTFCGHRRLDSI
jgi:hypothetical protein